MIFKVTHIEWDIEDEGRDDNGLPITAKDLGLPAYDEVVQVECDSEDDIADALSDEYGFCVISPGQVISDKKRGITRKR